jgi:hypothetical protein
MKKETKETNVCRNTGKNKQTKKARKNKKTAKENKK